MGAALSRVQQSVTVKMHQTWMLSRLPTTETHCDQSLLESERIIDQFLVALTIQGVERYIRHDIRCQCFDNLSFRFLSEDMCIKKIESQVRAWGHNIVRQQV